MTPSTASDPTPAIERRTALSPTDFANEYVRANRPVILSDALKGWPALDRWTPQFFQQRYPDKEFIFDNKTHRFADFIDLVLQSSPENPAPYLRNQVLREHFPDLLGDIDARHPYFRPNWMTRHYRAAGIRHELHRGSEIEIYIGGNGRGFPVLHWDGIHTHAFLMQIHGRKQFFVYGPEQTPYMYPWPEIPNVSQVNNVEQPDLARFPLFAEAVPTVFVLEPGEMLFVPSGWWHTTRMLTPSVSLSINTANGSNWRALATDIVRRERGFAARKRALYLHAVWLLNLTSDSLGMAG